MKLRYLALTFALLAPLSAQDEPKPVTVDVSKLPPELRKQIETAASLQNKAETVKQYGSWAAGMGHEIGTAVNESLAAVSDQAQKLADSKLGYFVMALVAFKIIGGPLIHLVWGVFFFLFSMAVLLWSYRRSALVYVVKSKVDKDPGFLGGKHTTYLAVNGDIQSDRLDYAKGWHALAAFFVVAVTCFTIFSW